MDYIDKYKKAIRVRFSTLEAKQDRRDFYKNARLDVARAVLAGLIKDPRTPK
jgi:hypothetical protein